MARVVTVRFESDDADGWQTFAALLQLRDELRDQNRQVDCWQYQTGQGDCADEHRPIHGTNCRFPRRIPGSEGISTKSIDYISIAVLYRSHGDLYIMTDRNGKHPKHPVFPYRCRSPSLASANKGDMLPLCSPDMRHARVQEAR